jgi:hypothetical protein
MTIVGGLRASGQNQRDEEREHTGQNPSHKSNLLSALLRIRPWRFRCLPVEHAIERRQDHEG